MIGHRAPSSVDSNGPSVPFGVKRTLAAEVTMSEHEHRGVARVRERRDATGKLAVVRKDGSPHVVPIWFVLDGDDFVFNTGAPRGQGRRRCVATAAR